MKKVVIAGASVYGLNNLSDDSMFYVFCRELHVQMPDLEITLLARHPSEQLNKMYGLKSIKNLDFDSKEESMGNWFRGLNAGDPTDHLQAIWCKIGESDLLIIGGGPFIDLTIGLNRGLTPYVTLLVTIAKFLNVPVYMNGIHLGRPLATELAQEMTRFCISNSVLGSLREEKSRKLFADIGVPVDNLVTTADAGFGLDPITDMSLGLKVLNEEGIHLKAPKTIGVTFRFMYWLWKEADRARYGEMMAKLCDHLAVTYDADILFIPHCFYDLDHKYEDDRPGAQEIISYMEHKNRAHAIHQVRELPDILALFPHLDFIIGNRRHSLIFGAMHDVPGIGIGEVGHIKPIMDELNLDSNLFVSHEDYELEILKANVQKSWENQDEIRSRMKTALPALREKALMNARLACKLLGENPTSTLLQTNDKG